jgi:hypothetical protein
MKTFFPKSKKAFLVKPKIFFVDYYFSLHQIPRNKIKKKIFQINYFIPKQNNQIILRLFNYLVISYICYKQKHENWNALKFIYFAGLKGGKKKTSNNHLGKYTSIYPFFYDFPLS